MWCGLQYSYKCISLIAFNRMDRLYWVDSQLDQIGHISFEGYDRQTFSNIGQITQPYSLTIYTGHFVQA